MRRAPLIFTVNFFISCFAQEFLNKTEFHYESASFAPEFFNQTEFHYGMCATFNVKTEALNEFCIKNFAQNVFSPTKRNMSLRFTVGSISELLDRPPQAFSLVQRSSNSTDRILDNFDREIAQVAVSGRYYDLIVDKNVIVLTFNIRTNVAGLSIHETKAKRIQPTVLFRNTSLGYDVVKQDGFLLAAYLPLKLLEQIAEYQSDIAIAITIFFKDNLFMEQTAAHKTNGIAFGILIPGFRERFTAPVRLIYKHNKDDLTLKDCAYWNYGALMRGAWKEEYKSASCGSVEICEYYHVTHFGMLVSENQNIDRANRKALDIITFIGCMLSLIGIVGIFTTAILFKEWRKNKGNLILVNYAIATLLEIVFLYFSGYIKENSVCDAVACYWSGLLLHYIVLAQFFWVLVISYLQYKRYVQIIGVPTTRLVFKSCLVGWGAPAPFVLLQALLFKDSYAHANINLCYPTGLALYLGVVVPISIIVLINLVIFILIMKSLFFRNPAIPRLADNVTILKLRLVLCLFFQLGISWVFGFMSRIHITFQYLFCIFATNQGFVVFMLFIVFNESARRLYKKLFGMKIDTKTVEPSTSSRFS